MRNRSFFWAMLGLMILMLLIFKLYGEAQEREAAAVNADKPLTAAVSIVPQKAFVEAIGGELVDVLVMIPPGSSPETYEPTPRERERFNQAEIYFTIGVPAEEKILPQAAELPQLKIAALHEAAADKYAEVRFPDGGRDPHVWLSPQRVQVMAERIAEELVLLDPAHAQNYRDNACAYLAELADLDAELQKLFSAVRKKEFLVFHPAFGYLAADYDLTMYALEEEGKEATVQNLRQMIDWAKAENIRTIFISDEHAGRQAAAFAEEIGGKVAVLSPLAPDYSVNMREMAALIARELQ